MKTLLLNPATDPEALPRAAELLRSGELVAFPTETVYGLGGCVFNAEAIARIFAVKGRPADNPLIVHIAAPEQAAQVAAELPPTYWLLAEHFFPGPLTVVLRRHPAVPPIVSGGLDTVALRMPRHPIALELIRLTGEPLAAPSANRSGRPSPTCAAHVLEDLDGAIAAVVDGGACEIGLESTVVNLLSSPPVILRPGAITAEQLARVLGEPVTYWQGEELAATPSPGMKYRHYAPNARVLLVFSWEELQRVLSTEPLTSSIVLAPEAAPFPLKLPLRPLRAETLYAEFRAADRAGIRSIVVVCTPEVQRNAALMDRLRKAAAARPEEQP